MARNMLKFCSSNSCLAALTIIFESKIMTIAGRTFDIVKLLTAALDISVFAMFDSTEPTLVEKFVTIAMHIYKSESDDTLLEVMHDKDLLWQNANFERMLEPLLKLVGESGQSLVPLFESAVEHYAAGVVRTRLRLLKRLAIAEIKNSLPETSKYERLSELLALVVKKL